MANIALQKAQNIIAERKSQAYLRRDSVLESLLQHYDWNACQKQIREARLNIALTMGSEKQQQYQKQLDDLLNTQDALLKKYGVNPCDLQVTFTCPICNDEGYLNGKRCKCLTAVLTEILFDESKVDSNKTFGNSNETNKSNLAVYKVCKEIATKWPNTKICNVVLCGKTGTGKSYLCNAMAVELIKNGNNVLFMTAYQLNNTFLQYHLADVSQKSLMLSNLTDVDVLVIDDLGTENVLKNVTMEYLYLLINERLLNGKMTVVSTNLNLTELQNRYEDRIFYRLTDTKCSVVAQLCGKDKRSKQNN